MEVMGIHFWHVVFDVRSEVVQNNRLRLNRSCLTRLNFQLKPWPRGINF